MIREKVVNNPYILGVGSAKYLRVTMSPIAIGIIIYHEYNLIVHFIQGLSLLTASLVLP